MPNATVGADAPASPKSAIDNKYHHLAAQIAAEAELKRATARAESAAQAEEREIRASRDFSDAYSDWLKAKGGIEDPGVPEEEQAERYRAGSAAERRLFTTPAAWPDQVWQKLMAFEILLGEELLNGERRDSIILLSLASIKQDIHNLGLCGGGAS
jgi:hypothetical protein